MSDSVLLSAQNIGLDYPIGLYPQRGLRDAFIDLLRSPLRRFWQRPEVLPVLRDVSIELRRGDRLAILGVNGAGKTSLARILCGMIRPTRGQLRSFGRVEALFESSNGVMPELTGRENAILLCELLYDKPLRPEVLEEALSFSELGVFLDAPLKTYSKGMQTRLILSLVSAAESEVLILDEVFDGADVFFKEKIGARMRAKIERSGAAIMVSHAPEQVRELCNRVIVLDQGRVAFDGGVDEGLAYYLQIG